MDTLIETDKKYQDEKIYKRPVESEHRQTRTVIKRLCDNCGEEYAANLYDIKNGKGKYCGRSCASEDTKISQKGENNPAYKGKKDYIKKIKKKSNCKNCGVSEPKKLCFHHTDQKTLEVSRMAVTSQHNLQELKNEVEKCLILCRNCHRDKHYKGNTSGKKARYIREVKHKNTCSECGEKRDGALIFHHKNPDTKIDSVSKMATNRYSMKQVKEEIEKCEIVCSNCHAEKH